MFRSALDELHIELPDLGRVQALDGKELHSLAKGESSYPLPDKKQEDTAGRRDRDADWGVKGPAGINTGSATCCTWSWTPPTSCRWRSRSPRPRVPSSRRRNGCLIRCRSAIPSCWNGAVA